MKTRVSRRQVLQGLGATAAAGAVGRARLASAQAKVTLTYVNYSAGLDKPNMGRLIGEFSKANPNIAIRYQPIPGETWGDYFDKLATMIAGGNPPDVSRVAIEGGPGCRRLARAGAAARRVHEGRSRDRRVT